MSAFVYLDNHARRAVAPFPYADPAALLLAGGSAMADQMWGSRRTEEQSSRALEMAQAAAATAQAANAVATALSAGTARALELATANAQAHKSHEELCAVRQGQIIAGLKALWRITFIAGGTLICGMAGLIVTLVLQLHGK